MVMYGISGQTILKTRSKTCLTCHNGLRRQDSCSAKDRLIGPIGALPDTACLMACTALVHVSESGLNTPIQEPDQAHVFILDLLLHLFTSLFSCFWHMLSSLSIHLICAASVRRPTGKQDPSSFSVLYPSFFLL